MKTLTIATLDQIIVVDGVAVLARDYGGFQMTNGEWAVQFNGFTGHIEFSDNRDNLNVDDTYIQKHFSWAYDLHGEILIKIAEKEQAELLAAQESEEIVE